MLKITSPNLSTRPHTTVGQRISRKYRKATLRKLRRKEYTKLRAMVPSVAEKDKVSKVVVIEEAIKYIEELHGALATRLKSRGLTSEELPPSGIALLVRQLVPYHIMMSGVSVCEKQQKVASYIHRSEKCSLTTTQ